MKTHTFAIVDVFAEKKYAGNQLAVFTDAGELSDEKMQLFAKEMNYSETTFIPIRNGRAAIMSAFLRQLRRSPLLAIRLLAQLLSSNRKSSESPSKKWSSIFLSDRSLSP